MKCVACGKELGKKEVIFTEDKKPYCINTIGCNENHINSVTNILARQGAVKLYTEEQLETSIFDRFNVSDAMKERVIKITRKPQSIRLAKYDISFYLLQLQATKNLASISEAVRYCVNLAMAIEPITDVVNDVPEQEESNDFVAEQEDGVEITENPISVIEDVEPKGITINLNGKKQTAKDLVMAQIEEQEKETEDEFSF